MSLGKADSISTLQLAEVKARLGREIEGTFAGTEVKLANVPLDVLAGNIDRYVNAMKA